MNKSTFFMMSALLFSFLSSPQDVQAYPPPSQDMNEPFNRGRLYDLDTIETIKGEVMDVKKFHHRRGGKVVQLALKSDKETLSVRLGPSWFLKKENFKIKEGDDIEVKGSRITINNRSFIMAAEISKGDQKLILRDEKGAPVWRGERFRD